MSRIYIAGVLLGLVFLTGLTQSLQAETPPTATAEEKPMNTEIAKPPFAAAVIRDATKAGQTITFRLSGGGQPAILRTTVFVEVTAKDTLIRTELTDTDGRTLDGPKEWRFTWEQLEEHAHFPANATVKSEKSVTVPAGTYDCWVYVVTENEGDKRKVSEYAFARKLPGAPVYMSVTTDGKLETVMELVAHKPGAETTPKLLLPHGE